MEDDEIRSRFDGRGHVEIEGPVAVRERVEAIGHALGYRLIAVEESRGAGLALGIRTPLKVRLRFRRDDDPRARRRAERTIERLRAGGPVLADHELPPPAPPAPAPPLTPRPPAARPRRSMEPRRLRPHRRVRRAPGSVPAPLSASASACARGGVAQVSQAASSACTP